MGQIWRAEDVILGGIVAIKMLVNADRGDSTEDFSRIMEEARTLKSFAHSSVANMRDFGIKGNIPFLVMDCVEGSSLEVIRQECGGRLPEKEVLELLVPIARAIDYIHTIGKKPIIHRDIKPENIMVGRLVSESDEVRRSFLCDFGIANRRSGVTNNAWGTEYYRAPEVRPGAEVTPKADVYSFAVTAYVCLTGEFPPRWTAESFNTPLLRAISRGLSSCPDSRPVRCVELLQPHESHKQDKRQLLIQINQLLKQGKYNDARCMLESSDFGPEGLTTLGLLYLKGLGCVQNREKGLCCLKKAADGGSNRACRELYFELNSTDRCMALRYLEQAARRNDKDALFVLATENKALGNLATMERLYEKGAKLGDPRAMRQLNFLRKRRAL